MSRIVLASASPRRKELLEQIGLEFEICPAKGEEVITAGSVDGAVLELSRQKAEEVAAGILSYNEIHPELVTPQDILVIGADTVVACDGNILGKPRDEADAAHMLSMLSGHTHSVYTGVTLVFIDKNGRTGETSFYEKTDVCMYPLDDAEIRRYIAGGEPMDKPSRRYAAIFVLLTFSPIISALCSFPPIAYTERPNFVYFITIMITIRTMIAMITVG